MFIDRTAALEAEKMRTEFVANVGHELRAPLTSIMGFVETLQGPTGEDQVTREKFLKILLQQSQRMPNISDQLSLSKIEQRFCFPDSASQLNSGRRTCAVALDHQIKQLM